VKDFVGAKFSCPHALELQHLLPNPNALVAASKGMWAVKLCTKKKLQFLN